MKIKNIIASVLVAFSSFSYAGTNALSDAQFVTLRAAVCANSTAKPLFQAGNGPALNTWLNTATATLGWKAYVNKSTMDEAATYTTYDSLVAGKRDSWVRLLDIGEGYRDFTKNKIRNWIVDIWGSATAGSISEAILLAGTESITNAQVAIGGTVKTTGTVTATDRSYQGIVTTPETTKLIFQANGQIYTCP